MAILKLCLILKTESCILLVLQFPSALLSFVFEVFNVFSIDVDIEPRVSTLQASNRALNMARLMTKPNEYRAALPAGKAYHYFLFNFDMKIWNRHRLN